MEKTESEQKTEEKIEEQDATDGTQKEGMVP